MTSQCCRPNLCTAFLEPGSIDKNFRTLSVNGWWLEFLCWNWATKLLNRESFWRAVLANLSLCVALRAQLLWKFYAGTLLVASVGLSCCGLSRFSRYPKLFTLKRAQPEAVHTPRFLYNINRLSLCAVLFATRSLTWRFASWAHNWPMRTFGWLDFGLKLSQFWSRFAQESLCWYNNNFDIECLISWDMINSELPDEIFQNFWNTGAIFEILWIWKYCACHLKFPRRHRSSVLNIFDVIRLAFKLELVLSFDVGAEISNDNHNT